jgi:large subunit ribosomal protein L9
VKLVERRREKERQRLLEEKEQAQTRKTALETVKRFSIAKQVGEKDAIFGTVTAQEVADAIEAITKQEIDRRGITIPDIHKTGVYQVEVKLHPEVTATVEVEVVPS